MVLFISELIRFYFVELYLYIYLSIQLSWWPYHASRGSKIHRNTYQIIPSKAMTLMNNPAFIFENDIPKKLI